MEQLIPWNFLARQQSDNELRNEYAKTIRRKDKYVFVSIHISLSPCPHSRKTLLRVNSLNVYRRGSVCDEDIPI